MSEFLVGLSSVAHILGNVLMVLGVIAIYIGILGMFRFREFTLRLLSGAKIDTVGLILVLVGVALRGGVSWFSAKALTILMIMLIGAPVVTAHLAARSREEELPHHSWSKLPELQDDEPTSAAILNDEVSQ